VFTEHIPSHVVGKITIGYECYQTPDHEFHCGIKRMTLKVY